MNGSVLWLGDGVCLLETSDGAFSVTNPSLVSSIRVCVDRAAEQSKMQLPGSPTAATLASLFEVANVGPHEGPSVAPSKTRGFGSVLPRRQVSPLPDVGFAAVLEARHSVREFGAPSEADLLALLTHATRSRFGWPTKDGWTASSRPSPSAGARHPIEIVVAAPEVHGLAPGLYWFDPVQCRLSVLPAGRDEAQEVAIRAQAALAVDDPPPAVLCLVAELQRTLSRYVGGDVADSARLRCASGDRVPRSHGFGFGNLPRRNRWHITCTGCTARRVPRVGRGCRNRDWPTFRIVSSPSTEMACTRLLEQVFTVEFADLCIRPLQGLLTMWPLTSITTTSYGGRPEPVPRRARRRSQ